MSHIGVPGDQKAMLGGPSYSSERTSCNISMRKLFFQVFRGLDDRATSRGEFCDTILDFVQRMLFSRRHNALKTKL